MRVTVLNRLSKSFKVHLSLCLSFDLLSFHLPPNDGFCCFRFNSRYRKSVPQGTGYTFRGHVLRRSVYDPQYGRCLFSFCFPFFFLSFYQNRFFWQPALYCRENFSTGYGTDVNQEIKFAKGTTTLAFKVSFSFPLFSFFFFLFLSFSFFKHQIMHAFIHFTVVRWWHHSICRF